jgi:programmed cell death 6-interacting protein
MLAQAQEMVVSKAIHDKMKDAVIAKLCAQCEDLFANVMRSMQKETVRNIWDASWLPNVCGKQAIYNGMSQYHQSKVCNASKSIGEEIARYVRHYILLAAAVV